MSEIKIHCSLHHPNIVQFGHFFEDSENVYILLEICQNQTMNELLRRRKRLIELEVQCYLLQIIAGIKYLHQHRVIHRDLKLGNLFLTDKMEIKLADFGLATRLEFDGVRKRTVCGTPNYIAPEILEGKHGHSYEVDIWSLGVIIFTLLVGKPPFETSKVKTTYRRIKANAYNFPEHIIVSDEAKDLVIRVLNLDPLLRPTLDQILNHKFLRGKKIPKLLPASTMACPPPASFVKLYTDDIVSDDKLKLECTAPAKALGLYEDDRTSLADVEKVNALRRAKKSGPLIYVRKWVDCTSKYGLGYLLSNDCLGISFNDSTKILLHPNEL
jgi:polo-like kinase 1